MFAEGVAGRTPLEVGTATVVISFAVLLAWIPLRQRPGVGTVANAILIGVAIDAMLPLLGDRGGVPARVAFVLGGIALVAIGSGLYLNVRLGPGPRDGLMTGLSARSDSFRNGTVTATEPSWLVLGKVGRPCPWWVPTRCATS